MRKLFIVIAELLLCFSAVYSSALTDHFVSLHQNSGLNVLPEHAKAGKTADSSSSDAHVIVSQIMDGPFSLELADKYLDSSIKQAVVSVLAVKLQDIIPSESYIMSEGFSNGDGSTGIRVICKNRILDLAILDGKVTAIELDEGRNL